MLSYQSYTTGCSTGTGPQATPSHLQSQRVRLRSGRCPEGCPPGLGGRPEVIATGQLCVRVIFMDPGFPFGFMAEI
jgi:hypothetical protein